MTELDRRRFLQWSALAAGAVGTGLTSACSPSAPAPPTASPTPPAPSALRDLAPLLRGRLLRPGEPGFAAIDHPANARYRTSPAAIAACADENDVAACLTWARQTGSAFATRGGGHSYAGFSTTPGLMISTAAMQTLQVDDAGVATVGAGVRNAGLRQALGGRRGHGHWVLPTGTCPGVGIAGLTLGGGIGPNTRWAGLTSDTLTGTTVVTADGQVLRADDSHVPELFWALRGGAGGNFGINTSFTYQLARVPRRRVLTFAFEYDLGPALADAISDFLQIVADPHHQGTSGVFTVTTHPGSQVRAALHGQSIGSRAEGLAVLAPLLQSGATNHQLRMRRWWDAQDYLLDPAHVPAHSFCDRSRFLRETVSPDDIAPLLETLGRFPDTSAHTYGQLSFMGWTGGQMNALGPTDTSFVHRDSSALVRMSAVWPPAGGPDSAGAAPIPPAIRAWLTDLWDRSGTFLSESSYQNFPDPLLEDWQHAYYGQNLAGLRRVKTVYDPDDLFRFPQGIPPG